MEVPRDRLKLQDNERLISPPFVLEPVYQCSTLVVVRGFIPHATLDVEVDGVTVVSGVAGGFSEPDGASIHLVNPLTVGQTLRARQHYGGAVSKWSALVQVRDYLKDYPAGPPRPEINPAPQYQAGHVPG